MSKNAWEKDRRKDVGKQTIAEEARSNHQSARNGNVIGDFDESYKNFFLQCIDCFYSHQVEIENGTFILKTVEGKSRRYQLSSLKRLDVEGCLDFLEIDHEISKNDSDELEEVRISSQGVDQIMNIFDPYGKNQHRSSHHNLRKCFPQKPASEKTLDLD